MNHENDIQKLQSIIFKLQDVHRSDNNLHLVALILSGKKDFYLDKAAELITKYGIKKALQKAKGVKQMKSAIQRYYDTERNFVISCFWESGFTIRFGDTVNGYTKRIDVTTWEDVEKVFEEELKNGTHANK